MPSPKTPNSPVIFDENEELWRAAADRVVTSNDFNRHNGQLRDSASVHGHPLLARRPDLFNDRTATVHYLPRAPTPPLTPTPTSTPPPPLTPLTPLVLPEPALTYDPRIDILRGEIALLEAQNVRLEHQLSTSELARVKLHRKLESMRRKSDTLKKLVAGFSSLFNKDGDDNDD